MQNKEVKQEFYSLEPILKEKAQYNVIIGERSNGKTYSVLERALKNYCENGEQTAYIRRYREDFIGKRGEQLFASIVENGLVSKYTNGEYDSIKYYSGRWYLANFDSELGKLVATDEPFCFGFSLSSMEHDKSVSYPRVTTIIFDEFLTRNVYLNNEFVIFMNVLSTIIRHRDDVTIFMLGNTVNKYSPYFKEMGLKHIQEMEKGSIEIYKYGESDLKVAVEYCKSIAKSTKKSDIYFAFDNPSLSMITGGAWELAMYPHAPTKILPKDIIFIFFISFDQSLIQGEVIQQIDCCYLYFHEKTTAIQDETKDIIFTPEPNPLPNYFRNIRKGTHPILSRLGKFFKDDKVFFQDNEVGEVIRNYLNWCAQDKGVAL